MQHQFYWKFCTYLCLVFAALLAERRLYHVIGIQVLHSSTGTTL